MPLKIQILRTRTSVILNFRARCLQTLVGMVESLVITEQWIRERLNLTIDTLGEHKSAMYW